MRKMGKNSVMMWPIIMMLANKTNEKRYKCVCSAFLLLFYFFKHQKLTASFHNTSI